jgi:predicted neutral ceramidase superfamily lipid hydrolase
VSEADDQAKLDRELMELLNELRVALPGVQVLFAFLLTVPFSQRFGDTTTAIRAVFFMAFLATAVASILLLAPSVLHRLRWRRHDKDQLLRISNRLAIAGSAMLAVGIASVVFVISDFVYGSIAAAILTALVSAFIVVLWFVVPIVLMSRSD